MNHNEEFSGLVNVLFNKFNNEIKTIDYNEEHDVPYVKITSSSPKTLNKIRKYITNKSTVNKYYVTIDNKSLKISPRPVEYRI